MLRYHTIMQIYRPKIALGGRPRLHLASQSSPQLYRTWVKKERMTFRTASGGGSSTRPTSSKEAVESGLRSFQTKHYTEAVQLFNTALELNPSEDEAMAALYNLGCAYTKQKQWKPAAEAIVRAINDYKLKLAVALKVEI